VADVGITSGFPAEQASRLEARRVIGLDEQKSSTTETIPPKRIAPAPVPVKPDAATETELLEVLERFCSAFADRDAEAVMRLFMTWW
jgi:hypothetical protein